MKRRNSLSESFKLWWNLARTSGSSSQVPEPEWFKIANFSHWFLRAGASNFCFWNSVPTWTKMIVFFGNNNISHGKFVLMRQQEQMRTQVKPEYKEELSKQHHLDWWIAEHKTIVWPNVRQSPRRQNIMAIPAVVTDPTNNHGRLPLCNKTKETNKTVKAFSFTVLS